MKVTAVGTMCSWTIELSTSFIINDEIIFDTPQGSFKTIYNNYDLSNIKFIIISHFHSDHFMDIHLILEILRKTEQNITIIAPKGCKERLFTMFKIVEVSYLEDYVNNFVTFIECENGKTINLSPYKIKIYKMEHKNLDAYGFVIENDGVKIGFSGDSCACNSLIKILRKSDVAFIDCASLEQNNKHLSIDEFLKLKEEYKNVKLYPIHLTHKVKNILEEKTELINQGQTLNIIKDDKIVIN